MAKTKTINVGGVEYRPCDVPPGAQQQAEVKDARPTHSATKDVWVAYAVSQGVAEDEARAMTKDDLVARFDS